MITLNRGDLAYLLQQVTINYLAPDPNNPGQFIAAPFNYSLLENALDPSGIREVSGANNNLVGGYWDANTQTWVSGPYTTWGQSDQPFLNLAPGQAAASAPNSAYNTPGGPVSDGDPRLISNLIATSFKTGPNANPAIVGVATNNDPNAANYDPNIGFVANAGVLGGGAYNQWFVAFGQFFDHGLDFVARNPDPTAKITVNLSPNDPLYSLGADGVLGGTGADADVTSISIRRANVANAADAGADNTFGTSDDVGYNVGADNIAGTADDIYAKAKYINKTGLLIDQSQTYGSVASVNALIREYYPNGQTTGRVVTGHTAVLDTVSTADDGDAKGLATWADVKVNALRIGVILTDADIHNAPMLRVDPAGKLMYVPNAAEGYTTAQITGYDPNNQDPNDPFVRDALGNVLRTGQDMLLDSNPMQPLDAHIITGDGRGNENIGLTTVHHVFHEEHNGQVANIQASILAEYNTILGSDGQAAADAFIAPWQSAPGVWDGEKLFQAARIITETEYNHIAIDQYVGTLYGALPEFVSYSSDINMGVSLEFSQAVFRLGHSMLTETFDVAVANDPNDPNAGTHQLSLLEAFTNPNLYAQLGPSALALGLTGTLGNEVDEFVTPALQQSLLGQPLDLATINIARGRDVGLPTWNEFRQQIYSQMTANTSNTNGGALAPYVNWADVFDHLKNTGTGVNMIAAYARDTGGSHDWGIDEARAAYMAGTGTLDAIRAAAQSVYDAYLDVNNVDHAAAVEFMKGTPSYDTNTNQWVFTGADQGFWDIDLWIGGLAERPLFDGPLGTTFSFVILDFAQRQQDGDRFYYLYRLPMGTHLGTQIVENQFANLVMEHTGLQHLNGDIFIYANGTFNLTDNPDYFNAADHTVTATDGSTIAASNGHIVIGGGGGNDFLIAGLGDDTIYGDDGNDQIFGSQGNDHLYGGAGDDYIFDDENDDFIAGGAGNDRIFAGPGVLDTVFGDGGNDEIHGGDGIDELSGGDGDDMLYGDGDTDVLFGDAGNDYVEGGDSVDEVWGGDGNDWLRGGVGDDGLQGGAGNDLLEGGVGPAANDGDRLTGGGDTAFFQGALSAVADPGFDVVSYEDVDIAITADLETSNQNGTGGLMDTYVEIDGLVGSRFNDKLTGASPSTTTSNGAENLLVGGAGDDILTGLGGNDIIIGDSIAVKNDLSVYFGPASAYTTINNWKGTGDARPDFGTNGGLGHFLGDNGVAGTGDMVVFSGARANYTITHDTVLDTYTVIDNRAGSPDGTDTVFGVELFKFSDMTLGLNNLLNNVPVVNGTAILTASNEDTLRVITMAELLAQVTDNDGPLPLSINNLTASSGTLVNNGNGTWNFTPNLNDNTGVTFNFNVTDGTATVAASASLDLLPVNDAPTGGVTINDLTPTEQQPLTASNLLADVDSPGVAAGTLPVTYQWQVSTNNGTTWTDIAGAQAATFTPAQAQVGAIVRVVASYVDGGGTTEHVPSAATAIVGDFISGNNAANTLNGTAGADRILGNGGSDTLNGLAGDDILEGGNGSDTLNGGDGNDLLLGGAGTDTLNGGNGNDRLDGGSGGDTMRGNAGDDTYVVSQFSDQVSENANAGIDTIETILNNYMLNNNVENLTYTGAGDFTGNGNNLDNTITGGAGDDTLNGNGGIDTLIGGLGNDFLNGGSGNDIFLFATNFGDDSVQGFDANPTGGQDHLMLDASLGINATNFAANVFITAAGGNTLITIGADTITLLGVSAANVTQDDFLFGP